MAQRVAERVQAAGEQAVDQQEAGQRGRRSETRARSAAQGQPVQLHGEQQLQLDGEPEGGDGDAAYREDAQQRVGPAVVVDGGDGAERDAEQRG